MNPEEKDNLLRTFFRQHLVALKDSAQAEIFGRAGQESFYVERNDDGNYVHEINFTNPAKELKKIWAEKSPELAEKAEELILTAEKIQDKEEVSEEVSPFIYQMF